MYKAVRRSFEESENEYGFIDEERVLAILILTDEADCSYNTDWEAIFYPASEGGNEVFWSLPGQPTPTSAVCWNAGVACVPDGASVYDDCVAQDKAFDGGAATNEDDAVIFPVSRYVNLLQGIEDVQKELNPAQEVVVAAIAGVPEQYPDQPIIYMQGPDPDDPASFQARYGIAEGCIGVGGNAVPPVRIREFADAFAIGGQPALSSVCSNSYFNGLTSFTATIGTLLRPSCMPACVADDDPVTPLVDPKCVVIQTWRDSVGQLLEIEVPQCNDGVLPSDADVCWVPRVDKTTMTPTAIDDVSFACADEGWNLEFGFVRRDGVPYPTGASLGVICDLSQNKAVDCPELP
jgi:hypothetical protein